MPKPLSSTQLRYIGALQEAGFKVERRSEYGHEFLISGYGKAAMAGKLDSCVKKLHNKMFRGVTHEGIRALEGVMKQYQEGAFLNL